MNIQVFLCLILSLLFWTSSVHSQDAKFQFSDTYWRYSIYGDNGQDGGNFIVGFSDSLVSIADKEYHALDTYGFGSSTRYQNLREEDHKVYLINEDLDDEVLLYDFNLLKGDTFLATYGFGINEPEELVVTNIDTIQTLDGISRKKFYLTGVDSYAEAHWVEGIGDAYWLFYNPAYWLSLSGGFSILCYFNGDAAVYPTDHGMGCDPTSTNQIILLQALDIFPNPSLGKFSISSKNLEIESYQIIDLRGNVIKTNERLSGVTLFEESLSEPGVYFIRCRFSNKKIGIQKIMVIQD